MGSQTKIRVGLIGAGEWARLGHVPALRSLPNYELVAVATTRLATAKEAATRFDIPHACEDAARLIARDDIDLVIVNNRAPEHFTVAEAVIAAGKHIYCEWPLTTNTTDSTTLLEKATRAGVRHAVGLQRRMASSRRYLHELVTEGYVGQVRSVNMRVTEPSFSGRRPKVLGFTIPNENFSNVASIYGGHFLDMLFAAVGEPKQVSGLLASQFGQVTIVETDEVISTTAPDQMLISGTLGNGAMLSVHVEGGKLNGYGVCVDVTGTEGDLRLTYEEAFSGRHSGRIAGARGERQPLVELPIPERLEWVPGAELHGSVLELANLFAAFAHDLAEGTSHAPTFADAVRLHRFLDAVAAASATGQRVTLPR